MTALLRYAQSIDAIVAAGNEGAASAGKVADSVKGLAEAAGVTIPGSAEAVAVATDTVKFLYGQIAKVRAANDLAAALDTAQPAIERITQLMRKDLADLDVIAQAAAGLQAATLAAQSRDVSADRKTLHAELRKFDLTDAVKREDYAKTTKLLADVDARYVTYQRDVAAVEERLRASRAVIDASGRALEEWASAHAALAVAARHKGRVSTQSLSAAVVELRDLVKRMREL